MPFANYFEQIPKQEWRDLAIAVAALAFGFTVLTANGFALTSFFISVALVVITFIPHELAHRTVARIMDVDAHFRLWPVGTLLAILTPFLGILFAAPGAVTFQFHYSRRFGKEQASLTLRHVGLIAIAGPFVNIAIGLVLAGIAQWIGVAAAAARLSFILAFFNLIPIPPLDGEKVMRWRPLYWFVLQVTSLALLLLL